MERKQNLWSQKNGFSEPLKSFPDIIGYKISIDDENDCELIATIIESNLMPQRLINYFHQPRETGFKAFLYYLENQEINSEIQIMSTRMRDWTNETHGEHEKLKYGTEIPRHTK